MRLIAVSSRKIELLNTFVKTTLVMLLITSTAAAADYAFSDIFTVEMDPASKKQLGKKTFDEVMDFFNNAEQALETKNIDKLMALYSDNYANGMHDKKSARKIWERIFKTFDKMATQHSMRIVQSSNKDILIIQCTGLLTGTPQGEKYSATIDNWNNQNHVISKENGQWKLVGTSGMERKRLWFDEPMHPLF